jgi:hypothetical protein
MKYIHRAIFSFFLLLSPSFAHAAQAAASASPGPSYVYPDYCPYDGYLVQTYQITVPGFTGIYTTLNCAETCMGIGGYVCYQFDCYSGPIKGSDPILLNKFCTY